MSPASFLLAVPRSGPPYRFPSLEPVRSPGQVCALVPRLWTGEGAPVIDLGPAGRILGVLFLRSSGANLTELPAHAPVHSGPQPLSAWLLRECWGAYVAVLGEPSSGEVQILSDPSGLLPVYRHETPTHVLLTSHPALLREAGTEALRISWPALHSFLMRPELRQRPTCLECVTELTPGALLFAGSAGVAGATLWQPRQFLPGEQSISFNEAAEELRSLAMLVLHAWATQLGPVAVAASGGVDSSLICAALAKSGTGFSCITLATRDPSGDERPFVRLLADHLGVRSLSAFLDPGLVDPQRPASSGLPRPARKPFLAAIDAMLLKAARSLGANTIFDGNGGDNLFCFLHSAAPIVDRLRSEGPGRGSLSTLIDMCRVTGCDVPVMSRAVLRRLVRHKPSGLWPADTRLLADAPDRKRSAEPLTPWLDTQTGHHGGKRDHLALIMRSQNHLHGLGAGGLPRFSPLMSQPLLEFCLAVPSWIWCAGGINRAPARAAFAGTLPPEIALRSSKSGPDSFIRHSFVGNRSTIRDLLLGGLLADHGLLDLAATRQALGADAFSGGSIIYRLLDLAEAEAWARSWQG